MLAVTRAGDQLVAVGHADRSSCPRRRWDVEKSRFPWLTSPPYFVDAKQGWAVGHDGVVLHTDDAGDTWRLQLDGRANELLVAATEGAGRAGVEEAKGLAEAERYKEQPDDPFLDVGLQMRRTVYWSGLQPDLSYDRRRQHLDAMVRPFG
jgi:hypothetical protein